MANIKDICVYKMEDLSSGDKALLEILPSGAFTLYPTDASYNKIELATINGSYSRLYYEALRIQADIIGNNSDVAELEQRIGWVQEASSITFTHSGGDYTVSDAAEQDVFVAVQSSTLQYLNEELDESE